MDIIIKTTRRSSRTNKNQIEDLFRIDENKSKKGNPRIWWFCASGTVEILNVCWPFIKLISKEVQVDWWIQLQKLRGFKEKYNKQFLCWCYTQKREFIIHPEYFDANNIFSNTFIQNIKHKPKMVQDLSRKIKIAL